MASSSQVLSEIDGVVRGGFAERDQIIAIFCEEMYAPGELDEADVTVAVDRAIAALEKEKQTWPLVTDCDKLDQVFVALNALGIVALQNAGNTQSDGYGDVREVYNCCSDRDKIIGYCFYHGQDLERAVHGGGLYLAFGPIEPEKEQVEGPRIGEMIVEELRRMGFAIRWNGTFNQRIHVPAIDWKRR